MRRTIPVWLCVIFAVAYAGHADISSNVSGDWTTQDKAIVRLFSCGQSVCLKIVKLSPTVPEKKDAKNPDASLRGRSLCGLNIGSGFHQVDATHLADGHLYDPESGRTYSGSIVNDGDALRLRGYIGISLLGRTETWHRAAAVKESECR